MQVWRDLHLQPDHVQHRRAPATSTSSSIQSIKLQRSFKLRLLMATEASPPEFVSACTQNYLSDVVLNIFPERMVSCHASSISFYAAQSSVGPKSLGSDAEEEMHGPRPGQEPGQGPRRRSSSSSISRPKPIQMPQLQASKHLEAPPVLDRAPERHNICVKQRRTGPARHKLYTSENTRVCHVHVCFPRLGVQSLISSPWSVALRTASASHLEGFSKSSHQ